MTTRPALTVIDGGRVHPKPASPAGLAMARTLARQHFAAMMCGTMTDSITPHLRIATSSEGEEIKRRS